VPVCPCQYKLSLTEEPETLIFVIVEVTGEFIFGRLELSIPKPAEIIGIINIKAKNKLILTSFLDSIGFLHSG